MQNGGFDSWDQQSGSSGGQKYDFDFGGQSSGKPPVRTGGGGWHWLLTLVALVTVSLLSLGMAFLTKDVEERPVWMMGLIFMVPTAALMLAAMMVESATSAMTPGTSRGPQMKVAIAATIATFLVGVICDLIYLQGFKNELIPARTQVEAYEITDRLILIADPTKSMEGTAFAQATATVGRLLDAGDESWQVGMVRASTSAVEKTAIGALDAAQKKKLNQMGQKTPDQGRMYYADVLQTALEMAEGAGREPGTYTRIVILTDGNHPWSEDGRKDLTERCRKNDVIISCVLLGSGMDDTLEAYIRQTGGGIVTANQAVSLVSGMRKTMYREQVKAAEIPKEEKLSQDLIRNNDSAARVITLVMLLMEGISLGICLSLMLSLRGQFRAQYFISPLMGALAFVLLKIIWKFTDDPSGWWLKEGLSFSLLGLVLMMRNYGTRNVSSSRYVTSSSGSQDSGDFSF